MGAGNNAPTNVRASELAMEREVSSVIRAMPFLWLPVGDAAGPTSQRGDIERNTIALLSNFAKPTLDPPSEAWLGLLDKRDRIRRSGLWNSNHVDDRYDPAFLLRLENLIVNIRGEQ